MITFTENSKSVRFGKDENEDGETRNEGYMSQTYKTKNKDYLLSDPNEWSDLYRDSLLKFALKHFCDYHIAEELVQETFLAALHSRKNFASLSSERTWLFGILRYKIVNMYRKLEKEGKIKAKIEESQCGSRYFEKNGYWKRNLPRWSNPEDLLQEKEFWEIFDKCISELPNELAMVLRLKILEKNESDEICKILDISMSNLWVRLHRARSKMRKSLKRYLIE